MRMHYPNSKRVHTLLTPLRHWPSMHEHAWGRLLHSAGVQQGTLLAPQGAVLRSTTRCMMLALVITYCQDNRAASGWPREPAVLSLSGCTRRGACAVGAGHGASTWLDTTPHWRGARTIAHKRSRAKRARCRGTAGRSASMLPSMSDELTLQGSKESQHHGVGVCVSASPRIRPARLRMQYSCKSAQPRPAGMWGGRGQQYKNGHSSANLHCRGRVWGSYACDKTWDAMRTSTQHLHASSAQPRARVALRHLML